MVQPQFIAQWRKKIFLLVIVFILAIVAIGYVTIPPSCYEISDCKACWASTEQFGTSQYCPTAESCKIEPYIDQHNALVDVLLCACSKASSANYADPQLNRDINSLYQTFVGGQAITQEICKEQNPALVKWFFES
ncbi:MAG: hypothetical protein ABIG30_02970 [Candidatus Aenigmatarchaeota archaeon]